jgi:hypothetical protein
MRALLSAKAAAAALLGLVSAAGWLFGRLGDPRGEPPAPLRPGTPVVVELFSSEGCSSCPPADAYLAALDRTQPFDGVPVLALEEHVDYWDRLGWRDPYAKADFGARQAAYAGALADHRVYTPQIVVDGHLVVEGGDEEQGRRVIRESGGEPKARVAIARAGSRLTVDVTDVPRAAADDPAEVWVAVTESGLATDVARGENAGHHLTHAPIVRLLRSLGRVTSGAFHVEATVESESSWKPRALRTVVFVQLAKSRRIVGAASA